MTIRPPVYKDKPYSIQFDEMAADWVRGNEEAKARGAKRSIDIPIVLLDTAVRAGKTHPEIRSALGISPNTLTNAIKRAGFRLPRTAAERTVFLASAPSVPEQPVPNPDGILSAWAGELKEIATDATVSAAAGSLSGGEVVEQELGRGARPRLKVPRIAEKIARRMIGDDADRQIPGTYTARDGVECCDGLIGKGPEARPTVYVWREKAMEVEEVLKICRDIQAEASSGGLKA